MRRYLLAVVACAVVFVASLTEEGDARPEFARGPEYGDQADMDFEALTYTINGRANVRDFQTNEPEPYWATRAKVPGGWFVALHNGSGFFYPDPDHAWDGKSIR